MKKRVLVVDDEPRIRRFVRMNLDLEGYDVMEAEDGLIALTRVRDGLPDLVLLDVMMPDMDGFETLERIRETSSVPVIMLTNTLVSGLGILGINQAPANAMLAVLVTDCATPPAGIGGATVTVTQGGTAVGDAPFDASSFDPQGNGAWFITNVPPGDTTVSATYNGMTFRAHVVGAVAGTTTTTQVKPGF